MINRFLAFVAKDIIEKYGTDLSNIAVVFPNKRATLYLNEYLGRFAKQPLWSPKYMTIRELFQYHRKFRIADDIKLINDLYKSYILCTGEDTTIDQFFSWGEVLLSDFDDVDKNLADAKQVFDNLQNYHELDDISYLTEGQKTIIQKYFQNFTGDPTELKKKFLRLWSKFYDIYTDFNKRLSGQELAYEGALYRQVVNEEDNLFRYDHYLFVGFNVLSQVEKRLFSILKGQGKAKFYWDFDEHYINADTHEAVFFLKENLKTFPNEFDNHDIAIYDNFSKEKKISFLSSATETAQALYAGKWLDDEERNNDTPSTAVILCDETLLPTIIHCVPERVEEVNVTCGFPLSQTPVSSLVHLLIGLRISDVGRHSRTLKLSNIQKLLQHPYARYISGESATLLNELRTHHIYFPKRDQLMRDEGLSLLFKDIKTDEGKQQEHLTNWIIELLRLIGINATDSEDQIFHESLFRMSTLMNRLQKLIANGDLDVNISTFERLVRQLIHNTNFPFKGEPVRGVQIMGVLETRNLDFDHILLLSCNEGNMPKGIHDSSFIPYAIRKTFGLTTSAHKVSIYAYYFYRLIQRAKDITLAYNNSTEGVKTGEMSRFMLQLLVDNSQPIAQNVIETHQHQKNNTVTEIPKEGNILKALSAISKLSPTAINRYLRCPLQFYYHSLLGLKEDNDDEEEIDSRIFGNIFHDACEMMYSDSEDGIYTVPQLRAKLESKTYIPGIVDICFKKDFFNVGTKTKVEYNGLQLINRRVIIDYLKRLLRLDIKTAPFKMVKTESDVETLFQIQAPTGKTLKIFGRIDRLDRVTTATNRSILRVIDYKTGVQKKDCPKNIDEIFDPLNISNKHSDYYLQSILYALIVRKDRNINPDNLPVVPGLLYIQKANADDYSPVLKLDNEIIEDIEEFETGFEGNLRRLLNEIFNPSVPFRATEDTKRCEYCPYIQLCGRKITKKQS